MKYPKKYLTTNPNIMKREIKKHQDKEDSDPSAYGPWDADYKSGKAGKGKKVPTKTSKYTKKFKELYGESEEFESKKNIVDLENFNEAMEMAAFEVFEDLERDGVFDSDEINESNVDKALKNKAKKSGFPLGILRQVFNRGFSAWKKGHIPGVTPHQWAHARVSSFIVGGKTTKMADKALYQRAKKIRRERRSKK